MANVAVRSGIPGARAATGVWRALGTARRYPIFPVAILMLVLVLPAIFADWVAPHDPVVGSLSDRLAPPFWVSAEGEGVFATPGGSVEHVLGTDKQGRDILSRIIYGARGLPYRSGHFHIPGRYHRHHAGPDGRVLRRQH